MRGEILQELPDNRRSIKKESVIFDRVGRNSAL